MPFEAIFIVIKLILALVLIIFLINLLLKYLSKYNVNRKSMIRLIEKQALDNNKNLYIIKVLDDYYLMSSSAGSDTIVRELDRDRVEEELVKIEGDRQDLKDAVNFKNFFKRKEKDED